MPHALKKFVLLGALLAVALALAGGKAGAAACVALALLAWLAWETRGRRGFRFSAGPVRERGAELDAGVSELRCQPGGTLLVLEGGGLSAWWAQTGRPRALERGPQPLAVLLLPGGGVLSAFEDRLSLGGRGGGEPRTLVFEPPLLRQSYRLLAAPDGKLGVLLTPWFAQAFSLDLGRLLGRVRYEDAGHYFKDAALARSGRGMLLAGTCLLPEEEGGSLEARWGWWTLGPEGASWTRAWSQVRDGYDNSQLRSVQCGGDPALLCVEWWRGGYGFELRGEDGAARWGRAGGERPALSPGGAFVAWEAGPDQLVLGDADGKERWRRRCSERVRLKRVWDSGACAVLEGRCLRRFRASGEPEPEVWLKNDAGHVDFDADGNLVLAEGRRAARVSLGRGF